MSETQKIDSILGVPIGPSSASPTSKKLIFVGRYPELQIFEDALWKKQDPSAYRVISLYAVGGQGKTALLESYRRRLEEQDAADIPVAIIDLEDAERRQLMSALISCRNALRKKGVMTHMFDLAFARHHALTRPGRKIEKDHPEFFSLDRGLVGDLTDLANEIFVHLPGVKVLEQLIVQLGTRVVRWYRSRGQPLVEHLGALNASQIRAELPNFLGADLQYYTAENQRRRPVVLVDGYECLWRDHPGGTKSDAADFWLRRLVEESPGCLFIVAGRLPVRWQRIDRDWGEILETHEVPPLDNVAIEQWLDEAGVVEEPIRQRVKNSSNGHPLAITLLLSSYAKLKASNRAPKPEDFPISHKDIVDRFLGHLDIELRTIYQIVAVPRILDRHIWSYLQQADLISRTLYEFSEVADEVFFHGIDPERRVMHAIVRSQLLEDAKLHRPDLLRQVQLAVFSYLDRSCGAVILREETDIPDQSTSLFSRDTCLSEAAELLALADPRSFPKWCERVFEGDVRGSKLRGRLLREAKRTVIDDPSQKIALARLCAETEPFSGDAEELVAASLTEEMPALDDQALDDLEKIVACLTPCELKMKSAGLSSQLRRHIRKQTPTALKLALDQDDRDEALRLAKLLVGTKPTPRFDIVSAAALTGDRGLALQAAQAHKPEDDDTRDYHAMAMLEDFILVHRVEWGLVGLESVYQRVGKSALLEHLAIADRSYSDYAAGFVASALMMINDRDSAEWLINQRLTTADMQGLEAFAAERTHIELEQLKEDWKAYQFEEGLARTRWYFSALAQLGFGSDAVRRVVQNCRLDHAMELVIGDSGEPFMFVSSPYIFRRQQDIFLLSEDQSRGFITDPDGWFEVAIPEHLTSYLGQCTRITFVLMSKYGQPLAGHYYNIPTLNPAQVHTVQNEVIDARKAAEERFSKAAIERPG